VVTTSTIPLTIDGVRLDTYAYNIETLEGRLVFPPTRGENPVVPGDDGSVFIPNRNFEDGIMTLQMWVRGADVDGLVPGGSSARAEFRKNLQRLTRIFGIKHRLLDIRQAWPTDPTTIQYLCTVQDTFDFSGNAHNASAKFAVVLRIPDVFGQDVNTTDYTSAAALTTGTTLTLTALDGGTAPVRDAIYVVNGPATNPRLTNPETGEWVQLNLAIASGTNWRFNAATWESRTGAGLTVASSDTSGTARVAETAYGSGGARFMTLTPRDAGAPQLTLTGTGLGANTQVLVRARRKFFL
jgi:hypothetical protein